MSSELRQKLADELSAKTGSAYDDLIKNIFTHGHIEIKREHWGSIYINALNAVFSNNRQYEGQVGEVSDMEFTDNEWTNFARGVARQCESKQAVLWGHKGTEFAPYKLNHLKLTLFYKKNDRASASAKNVDGKAEELIREATVAYFENSQLFKKEAKENLEKAQVYEHGTRQENIMSDEGGPASGKISGLKGPGSRTKMREGLEDGTTASGAAGIKTDNRLISALTKELKKAYRTESWFTPVHNIVIAKWADLFGYDTEIKAIDEPAVIKSELVLKAVMVPEGMSYNPGTFDVALKEHLKKFLTDKQFFKDEVLRLIDKGGLPAVNNIDKLFADSPSPVQRIEAAAIKLAAVKITENISKKFIKSEVGVKNAKSKSKPLKKKGNSKTKTKGGKFRTGTKKARVSKKTSKTGTRNASTPQASAVALKELINQALPEVMLAQMHPPALRNRTGRFRQSAEVTNVNIGPRGGTQIDYTYMRDPYETFEPGGDMGSRNRDPRKLIGASVREIAIKLTGNKFITTRRR